MLVQESENAGMLRNEAGAEVSRDANGSGGPARGQGDKGTREGGWLDSCATGFVQSSTTPACSICLPFKPQKDLLRSPARSQLPKLGWLHC